MHVFTAGLNQETNTFSVMPTTYDKFAETLLKHHGQRDGHVPYYQAPLMVFEKLAKLHGWRYTESLCAAAWPGGVVVKHVYESFRDEIIADLKQAMPVDMVILNLHGAMIAEGYDDCEGDLLSCIRNVIGPDIALGIELDPHTHLTSTMCDACDLILPMKEYPHSDFNEIAEQLFNLTVQVAQKKLQPTMAVFDCKMINMFPTTIEPMQSFVAKLRQLENSGQVVYAGVIHGFPWGDVADLGTKIIVTTNHDQAKADQLASQLGLELFAMRADVLPARYPIDAAIDMAMASQDKPVILVDFSDNPGGGAFGDSTFILQRLLQRNIMDCALSPLWDPIAAKIAISAGVGAQLKLRIGGKMGVTSGEPLDLDVTVTHIISNFTANFCGKEVNYGDCVALSCHGIDIVINTISMQTFDTSCFTAFNIDIASKKILVVKSSAHFRAAFEKLGTEIITVSTAGSLCLDFEKIPYQKASQDLWPRIKNPQPGLLPQKKN